MKFWVRHEMSVFRCKGRNHLSKSRRVAARDWNVEQDKGCREKLARSSV
jgi:hypothetical protein